MHWPVMLPPQATAAGKPQTEADWSVVPTRVCQGASIGSGAVILAGVTIGAGALIGAGAVVTKDVAPMMVGGFIYPFSDFATPLEELVKRPGYQADPAAAVKEAKAWPADGGPVVIHVETDPTVYAPDSESWWDVPVSQVSNLESTATAYAEYQQHKATQRPLVAPTKPGA